MSLITKDFRFNKPAADEHGHFRLRWALFAIACAGIGVVIASTNTETSHSAKNTSDSLPAFQTVTKSSDELARESFSLGLPELQARQKIIDDANNLSAKKWREFTVKSGDSLDVLFKRANIKTKQLDELMQLGDACQQLRKIFPKNTIRSLKHN